MDRLLDHFERPFDTKPPNWNLCRRLLGGCDGPDKTTQRRNLVGRGLILCIRFSLSGLAERDVGNPAFGSPRERNPFCGYTRFNPIGPPIHGRLRAGTCTAGIVGLASFHSELLHRHECLGVNFLGEYSGQLRQALLAQSR